MIRLSRKVQMLATTWVIVITSTFAADTALIEPRTMIADRGVSRAQVDVQIIAARRYDTFWNTGDEALARAALGACLKIDFLKTDPSREAPI
jgi:hypothetical protein